MNNIPCQMRLVYQGKYKPADDMKYERGDVVAWNNKFFRYIGNDSWVNISKIDNSISLLDNLYNMHIEVAEGVTV